MTAELARAAVGDIDFHDLGEVRLKDLLDPEIVYGVVASGLGSTFPPLRTLDRARHNLPVQRTRLIGRDTDVARVVELVHAHRLVTLTGIGGCGKTRLSLAVAAELGDQFADGAYLVELAAVADPERVPEVVAEVLGVRVASGSKPREHLVAVAAFLSRRDLLIVLDNCEHLLDAVADLAEELLSAGDDVYVLATSREALEIEGEQTHRVSSLAVGDGTGAAANPALELLLERAGEMHGGFGVDGEERAAAGEICARLDGLPLAIELAAAQLSHLSPRELLARLDTRFQLLVGGRNRRRQRQQTLQAMMDWSWELLSAEEQHVLACLSVFSGGWTLEAAEGVCGRLGHQSVAAVLRSLVAKSLVEPRTGARGNRYRLLETVRLFAQQKLVDLGRSMDARAAHCDWFVAWLEAVPIDERMWSVTFWADFIAEFDNISTAIEWAIDRRDFIAAAEFLLSGAGVFLVGIGSGQAMRWVSVLLLEDLDGRTRARTLMTGALAAVSAGVHDKIIPWSEEAAALSFDEEAIVYAVASTFHATPMMVRQPLRAAELLAVAAQVATAPGLALTRALINSYTLMAEFCAEQPTQPVVALVDAPRFRRPRLSQLVDRGLGRDDRRSPTRSA